MRCSCIKYVSGYLVSLLDRTKTQAVYRLGIWDLIALGPFREAAFPQRQTTTLCYV
jgi:hypothetical protein